MIQVDKIVNRVFNSNTYILRTENSQNVWLIDCGDIDKIIGSLHDDEKVIGVLITHGHSDHIYGLNKLVNKYPSVKIYTSESGLEEFMSDKLNFSRYHEEYSGFIINKLDNVIVIHGDTVIDVLGTTCIVHSTPGHDSSCLCYEIEKYLFTGDSYIPGVKVITKFPRSNKEQAQLSIAKILQLSDGKEIMPGHTLVN